MRIDDVLKGHGVGGGDKVEVYDMVPIEPLPIDSLLQIGDFSNTPFIKVGEKYYVARNTTTPQGHLYKFDDLNSTEGRIYVTLGFTQVLSMITDGDYIYISGSGNGSGVRIRKLRLDDLSTVAEGPNTMSSAFSLFSMGDFLYAYSSGYMYKLDKETLSVQVKSSSPVYSEFRIVSDGEFLYTIGSAMYVTKINPTDLSKVGQTPTLEHQNISDITCDGNYIYYMQAGGNKPLRKARVTTLQEVALSSNFFIGNAKMLYANGYIFIGGDRPSTNGIDGRLFKVLPSNLTYKFSIMNRGGFKPATIHEDFIYSSNHISSEYGEKFFWRTPTKGIYLKK